MFWMLLLLLVMGLVFFKLGVLTVWFGLLQGLIKLLFVLSGAFLVVGNENPADYCRVADNPDAVSTFHMGGGRGFGLHRLPGRLER